MVALLRFMYGLTYDACWFDPPSALPSHAKVYVVAEKYQIHGLKAAVKNNMKDSILYHMLSPMDWLHDFIDAVQTIVTGIASDNDQLRRSMVEACVVTLRYLHQEPEFLSLLRESPGMAVDIVGHDDLECGLPGDWVCRGSCSGRCTVMCCSCKKVFSDDFARKHRDEKTWKCSDCGTSGEPHCADCGHTVVWQRRGL